MEKLKLTGQIIENYRIEERIWQGATSTIYKGKSVSPRGTFGDIIAIKVLHPYRNHKYQIKMFLREFKIQKVLSHPNILKVYKAGRKGDLYYMFMEYINGESLRSFAKENKLSESQIIYIMIKTGEAISYIHSKKIVHNDIKPENIIIGYSLKDVKLIDFGYAEKISFFKKKSNLAGGTENYMAPERKKGIVDFKSDVYSYGVLLDEYLSMTYFYEYFFPVIQKAKEIDPSKRPSIEEILNEIKKIYENRNNI